MFHGLHQDERFDQLDKLAHLPVADPDVLSQSAVMHKLLRIPFHFLAQLFITNSWGIKRRASRISVNSAQRVAASKSTKATYSST